MTPSLREAVTEWDRQPSRRTNVTRALFIFEGWNLLLISVSLVCLSHVTFLAACPLTWWAVWVAGAGTVVVTGLTLGMWLTEGKAGKDSPP